MLKNDLLNVFKANNIPDYKYSISDNYADNCYVLNQTEKGWEVYYSSFCRIFKLKCYKTEEEAYQDLYNRVMGYVKVYSDDRQNEKWRFISTSTGDLCILFGINIYGCQWIKTDEKIILEDPYYEEKHDLNIYEVNINGELKRFASCEFTNSVYGFYIEC
ncbi:hypothetical protein LJB90_02580 [Eubacteriales bacterium OttesenSCG-928-G02]|nr:hypothetical protein [Eubacteriales bacterium OttesenSCG-928-G02]